MKTEQDSTANQKTPSGLAGAAGSASAMSSYERLWPYSFQPHLPPKRRLTVSEARQLAKARGRTDGCPTDYVQ